MEEKFYLCQAESRTGRVLSCASCCGTYNYMGHSRDLITRVLARQTETVATWDGTDDDMERVREAIEQDRPPLRFEVIYSCPFSGFVNAERTRVGCLLHPRVRGRDLRDYCRYGHRTCAEALCTSYTYLSPAEARTVMAAVDDWYLYGLCITDVDLVKGFIARCEHKLHAPLKLDRMVAEQQLCRAFADYLALKETWPYARDPGRFGKYYFVDRAYHIYQIDYHRFGVKTPPHNNVLLALGSVIETPAELQDAIARIDARVEAFLQCYEDGV